MRKNASGGSSNPFEKVFLLRILPKCFEGNGQEKSVPGNCLIARVKQWVQF
jgi:hypothetical protein